MTDAPIEHGLDEVRRAASALRTAEGVEVAAGCLRGCEFGPVSAGRAYPAEAGAIQDGVARLVGTLEAWSSRSSTTAETILRAARTLTEQDSSFADDLRGLRW